MSVLSFSAAEALQCVPYARQESGLELRGNAWTWWGSAAAKYERGNLPQIGSVIVFKKDKGMRYGHVAVVSDIIDSRKILVDHANWGRGRARGKITRNAEVIDTSPNNDWSSVRVWYAAINAMGQKNYSIYGFIYPAEAPGEIELIQASLDAADALTSTITAPEAADPWMTAATPQQGNTSTTTRVSSDKDILSVSPATEAVPDEDKIPASSRKKAKTTVTTKKKATERPGSAVSREAKTGWKVKVIDAKAKNPLVKTGTTAKKAPEKKRAVKK